MKQEHCSYISALVVAAVVSLAAFTSGCTTITTERAKAPLFDGAGGGFGSRPAGVEGPLMEGGGFFSNPLGAQRTSSFAAFPSSESWAEAISGPLDFGRGPVSAMAGRDDHESDPVKLESAQK